MIEKVLIPKLGQSEEIVTIAKWKVKEGDRIKKGDLLFEVETDKAVLEVESQFEGILRKIIIPEGKEVQVMTAAAFIGKPGDDIPNLTELRDIQKKSVPEEKNFSQPFQKKTKIPGTIEKREAVVPVVAAREHARNAKPSPRAKAFAGNYLINLNKVPGTGGKSGRITEQDVRNYLKNSGYFKKKITPAAFNLAKKEKLELLEIKRTGENGRITVADVRSAAAEKPQQLSAIRKIIAKRLAESKQRIPHFYVTVEIDMTDISAYRRKLKADGSSLSINDFIVKAVALTLKEFPMLNAETDGTILKYKSSVNIGIAVSLEKGLLVPVLKNADKKTLAEIHCELAELVEKARNGKLLPEEMYGGTFTISNMGMLDVENFAAIINPGQSGILAVSSIIRKPVVKNNKIVICDIMKITLSADHRIVDGTDGAKFVNAVRKKLEDAAILYG